MKRLLSCILVFAILLSLTAPITIANAVEDKSAAAVFGTAVPDGSLSEWSSIAEKYYLTNRVVDGTAQTTGYFQAMWDTEYLYIAGEIYDSTNDGGNDQLKVLFDIDGVPTGDTVVAFADRPNAGVHTNTSINYNPNGGANAWNPLNAWNGYLNPGNNVVAGYDSIIQYDTSAKKYVFEIKWYPTSAMKPKLAEGSSFGFDIQWSDYNGGSYANDPKITNIGWASTLVDWNNDLRTIGELKLMGAATAENKAVEIYKGTPTIDGDLSEWTDDHQLDLKKISGDAQNTGWIKLKWDEKGIYVGGQIYDAMQEADDILKIVLDFDGLPESDTAVSFDKRGNAGVYSWMMWGYCGNDNNPANPNPWNPQNTYGNNMASGSDVLGDGVNLHMMYYQYVNGVYNFEITLHPTDALKTKLVEGAEIGFDMQWVDRNASNSLNDTKNTVNGWASDEAGWTGDLCKIGKLSLVQYQKPTVKTDYVAFNDERLSYLGRWKNNGTEYNVSYWNAASVSLDFTGETLFLDLARKSSIAIELDGEVSTHYAAEGLVRIPVNGDGQHTVKVYGPGMHFKGFYVAEGSTIAKTKDKDRYAIFIGDSISEDLRSGTFNAGRLAGWDWAVYALGGIALSDGNGYYNGIGGWGYYRNGYYEEDPMAGWDGVTRIGMESAFFNYERPIDKASGFTPYDGFAQERQPDAIFIALGVNDYLQTQAQSREFVNDYVAFVGKLRQYYPNATIYIAQALCDNNTGLRMKSIADAAAAVCEAYDDVVFLSDTPSWGVEISSDGTHPSEKGYATVTEKIAQILSNHKTTAANAYQDTPVVDGNLQEWAADEKQYILNTVAGTADTTGWFKTKWDSEAIYIAGEIYDTTHDRGNDLLKVLFDADGVSTGSEAVAFTDRPNAGVHTTSESGYNPNGGAAAWNPLNAYNGYLNPGNTVVTGYNCVMTYSQEDGKYIFESVWYAGDALKEKLSVGGSIGLDIQWSDFNGGTYPNDPKITNIGWASSLVDWNNDLRTIGKLNLLGTGNVGVPYGTPTLDGSLQDWEDCVAYSLTKNSGDADDSGWFKLKWDSNAIYVGGQIADATKEDGDILKFFIDFDGRASGNSPVTIANRPYAGVYSWMMWGYSGNGSTHLDPKPWNPADAFGNEKPAGADVLGDGVNSHMLFTNYENGVYTFEMVLYPSDSMKAKLNCGTQIGFDVQWIDFNGAASADDTKVTTLGWASDENAWVGDVRKANQLVLTHDSFTVTYIADGQTVATFQVDYGQNVPQIPNVPERAHYTGSWSHNGMGIIGDTVIRAVYTPNARVQQWNLSLKGDIAINFHIAVEDVELPYTVIRTAFADKVTEVLPTQLAQTEDGYYVLTVSCAAAQMTKPVSIDLIIEDTVIQSKTYTVRQYADRILYGDYSETTKTIVREMLHYGAAAQNYFQYYTEDLANDGILLGNQEEPTIIPTDIQIDGRITNVSYYGSTLLFDSVTKVRFYLSSTESIMQHQFSINGVKKDPVQKDGLWYVESDGIYPQNLNQPLVLTISANDQTLSVSYSPMNYIVRMYKKGSEELKPALKAMYNLYLAAVGELVHTDYEENWAGTDVAVRDLGSWNNVDCIDDPSNWTVPFNRAAYNWTNPDDDYDWGFQVLKVGDTYQMWWTRETPWDSVWYAESKDLVNWTNAQCIAGFKHWNDYYPYVKQHIADPAVVYVDGVYYFWFETCAAVNPDMSANGDGVIIHATSTDGIHLNWYGGNDNPLPVLQPAAEDMGQGIYGVGMPSVIYKEGKFMMYYYDGKNDVMRLAVSDDGIHFPENKENPVVFDKAGASYTYNTLTNRFMMTICAGAQSGNEVVYVQESADGIHWPCSSWMELEGKAYAISSDTMKMRCFSGFVTNPYGMVDTATIYMTYTEGDKPKAGDWWMSTADTFEAHFAAVNLPEFAKRPIDAP